MESHFNRAGRRIIISLALGALVLLVRGCQWILSNVRKQDI